MANWLLPKRGIETNADAVKLFCFPQAGMGAAIFHAWSERLAPDIQVLPVELPGHASRMREPRATNLCQLSSQIVDALASSFTSGPYALFGHSMGAWVAWEVLQELSRRQLALPLQLYVSGNRAAALCGAEHDLDTTRLHTLEADDFWQAFERRYGANPQLADPKIRAFVYPMLKDDFTLVETYNPSEPDVKTNVPITAIGARLDNRYTAAQVSAWQQHTTAALQEVWLEGLGHNYIADAPDSLLRTVSSQLSAATSSSRSHQAAAGPSAAAAAVLELNKQQQQQQLQQEQQCAADTAALQQPSSKDTMLPSQPRSPTAKHCCPCQ